MRNLIVSCLFVLTVFISFYDHVGDYHYVCRMEFGDAAIDWVRYTTDIEENKLYNSQGTNDVDWLRNANDEYGGNSWATEDEKNFFNSNFDEE